MNRVKASGVDLICTCGGQLILHLQQNSLSYVLQEADYLFVPQFGQIDAVHRLNVVAHIELVTPTQEREESVGVTIGCLKQVHSFHCFVTEHQERVCLFFLFFFVGVAPTWPPVLRAGGSIPAVCHPCRFLLRW